jgi:hypothetical protein
MEPQGIASFSKAVDSAAYRVARRFRTSDFNAFNGHDTCSDPRREIDNSALAIQVKSRLLGSTDWTTRNL